MPYDTITDYLITAIITLGVASFSLSLATHLPLLFDRDSPVGTTNQDTLHPVLMAFTRFGRLERHALAAGVLDLITRGYVKVCEHGTGRFVFEQTRKPADKLLSFEAVIHSLFPAPGGEGIGTPELSEAVDKNWRELRITIEREVLDLGLFKRSSMFRLMTWRVVTACFALLFVLAMLFSRSPEAIGYSLLFGIPSSLSLRTLFLLTESGKKVCARMHDTICSWKSGRSWKSGQHEGSADQITYAVKLAEYMALDLYEEWTELFDADSEVSPVFLLSKGESSFGRDSIYGLLAGLEFAGNCPNREAWSYLYRFSFRVRSKA